MLSHCFFVSVFLYLFSQGKKNTKSSDWFSFHNSFQKQKKVIYFLFFVFSAIKKVNINKAKWKHFWFLVFRKRNTNASIYEWSLFPPFSYRSFISFDFILQSPHPIPTRLGSPKSYLIAVSAISACSDPKRSHSKWEFGPQRSHF